MLLLICSIQAQRNFKIQPYSEGTWVYYENQKGSGVAAGANNTDTMTYREAILFAYRKAYQAKRQYVRRKVQLEVLEIEQRRLQNMINSDTQLDSNYFDISVRQFSKYLGEWRLIIGVGEQRVVENVDVTINTKGKFRITTRTGDTSLINLTGRLNTGMNVHTDQWLEITNLFDEKIQLYDRKLYGIEEQKANENKTTLPFFLGRHPDGRRVVFRQTKVFVEDAIEPNRRRNRNRN